MTLGESWCTIFWVAQYHSSKLHQNIYIHIITYIYIYIFTHLLNLPYGSLKGRGFHATCQLQLPPWQSCHAIALDVRQQAVHGIFQDFPGSTRSSSTLSNFSWKKPPPSQHPSTNQHQLSHSPHSFHRRKIWYTWLSDYQWLAANEALVGFHGFTPARFDKAMKVGHSCHSLVLEDRHVVTCVNGTGTWRHRQSVSGFKWCPGWFVDFWVKNLQHRFKYNLISMMNMIRCDIMWYINVYSNVYIMYRIQNDMTTHNNQVLIRIPCHSHMYIEYIQI